MNKSRILVVCIIWCGILGLISLCYKIWLAPDKAKQAEEQAKQVESENIEKTGSHSRFNSSVAFGIDSFSGYAFLRSPVFNEECTKFGIKVNFVDDNANYEQRLKSLAEGKLDFSVFTIDALIKASQYSKTLPATIVTLIDESKGADAILAAGTKFPNIDSLNKGDLKIVCVKDSPSETLARVCMAYFNLNQLSNNSFEYVNDIDSVYKQYQQAKNTDNKVFVLWEPFVTRAIQNPDYHILVDSSKIRGYFLDVIVVRRDFLLKNEQLVEHVMKSYLTSVFHYRNSLTDLILDDAKLTGQPLKKEQADRLCKLIWWKNTRENMSHFGFDNRDNLPHLEQICGNITDVLIKTGAIGKDPANNKPNLWYYDGIMRKLHEDKWHPGFTSEDTRSETKLLSLTDDEWAKIKVVGTLQVPRLVFSRGTSQLTAASENTLADLVVKLNAWPQYYLIVRGNASSEGDLEANKKLSITRAQTALDWLINHGVDKNRIRVEIKTNGSTTVEFIFGETQY